MVEAGGGQNGPGQEGGGAKSGQNRLDGSLTPHPCHSPQPLEKVWRNWFVLALSWGVCALCCTKEDFTGLLVAAQHRNNFRAL
jgi:hypothetical protein